MIFVSFGQSLYTTAGYLIWLFIFELVSILMVVFIFEVVFILGIILISEVVFIFWVVFIYKNLSVTQLSQARALLVIMSSSAGTQTTLNLSKQVAKPVC